MYENASCVCVETHRFAGSITSEERNQEQERTTTKALSRRDCFLARAGLASARAIVYYNYNNVNSRCIDIESLASR